MIEQFMDWAANQIQSGIVASGAALGLAGGAVATIHHLVPKLGRALQNALTTSISVDSRSSVFDALILWLHHHPYAQRCRRLSVTLKKREAGGVSDGTSAPIFSPAPGSHLLHYHARPIWLVRAQSTKGPSDTSGQSGCLSETLTLAILGRDRSVLHDLIIEALDHYNKRNRGQTKVYALDEYLDWREIASIPPSG